MGRAHPRSLQRASTHYLPASPVLASLAPCGRQVFRFGTLHSGTLGLHVLVGLRCLRQQRPASRRPKSRWSARAAPHASATGMVTRRRRTSMSASVFPNFLVIVSDTFRRDHLGVYGNPFIRTPYLDEFARQSVVFDHHLLSSFPTMPARAEILTGTFSYTHMGWEPLPRHLLTLPEVLSRAGYLTMGVVDTPFFIRNGFGYDRGFDDFVWVRGQGDDTRPHERADARSTWGREEDRMVARTMTEAERWLERHHDEQFFLYVDTWDPHEPWDAPDYYTARYREGYAGEQVSYPCYGKWKESGCTEDEVDLAHAAYCGEVTMVDFWIGRLLAKLDALGLRENTLVFFTSDHGFYFGEHEYFGKAEWVHDPGAVIAEGSEVPEWFSRSWLLTIGWSPLYQELTRVPLIVRTPGVAPGRRRALTTAPDIPATILELAGVEAPPEVQGSSF